MLLYFSVHKKATNHIKNTIEKFELPKGKQTVFLLMKKTINLTLLLTRPLRNGKDLNFLCGYWDKNLFVFLYFWNMY